MTCSQEGCAAALFRAGRCKEHYEQARDERARFKVDPLGGNHLGLRLADTHIAMQQALHLAQQALIVVEAPARGPAHGVLVSELLTQVIAVLEEATTPGT